MKKILITLSLLTLSVLSVNASTKIPPVDCTLSDYRKHFSGSFTATGDLVTYYEKFDSHLRNGKKINEFLKCNPDIAEGLMRHNILSDFRIFRQPVEKTEGEAISFETWNHDLKIDSKGIGTELKAIKTVVKEETGKKIQTTTIFDLLDPMSIPVEKVDIIPDLSKKLKRLSIQDVSTLSGQTDTILYVWGLYSFDVNLPLEWGSNTTAISHTYRPKTRQKI